MEQVTFGLNTAEAVCKSFCSDMCMKILDLSDMVMYF